RPNRPFCPLGRVQSDAASDVWLFHIDHPVSRFPLTRLRMLVEHRHGKRVRLWSEVFGSGLALSGFPETPQPKFRLAERSGPDGCVANVLLWSELEEVRKNHDNPHAP